MIRRCIITISLLFLLAGLIACGGSESPPAQDSPAEAEAPDGNELAETELPDGNELVEKMEAAMKGTNSVHFTVAFQLATAQGGIDGTLEVWAERLSNLRVEVTSDTEEVNASIVGSNETESWIYNPAQSLFYKASKFISTAHLPGQPELRRVIKMAREAWNEGTLGQIEATTLGSEQANGRDTYKVEVVKPEDDEESALAGATIIFWIDQETSLPQQIEVILEQEGVSANGLVILQGEMEKDQALDASLFTFEPPEETEVIKLGSGGKN